MLTRHPFFSLPVGHMHEGLAMNNNNYEWQA